MNKYAREALVIACCCFAGFVVSMGAALVFSFATWGSGSMGNNDIALGLFLFGMLLGMCAAMLAVYNWDEWWTR